MADSSSLDGLVDRAEQLLELVDGMANGVLENNRAPGEDNQRRVASAWSALLPTVIKAGKSLLSDPHPIANWVREVGRVSRQFDGAIRQHGLADVLLRFNCDGFIRVAEEGRALLKGSTTNRDPFAFVDEPAASNPSGIDATPALPRPPVQFVEAAARDIPSTLANVEPCHDGAIELIASHLAKRLQDTRHTLAAAQWAIHESIRAGRLQPGLIEFELPSLGNVFGTMQPRGRPDAQRMEWTGGGKATISIPKGKPAPFDNFKVTATESLWAWWNSSAVGGSRPGDADAGDFGFRLPTKTAPVATGGNRKTDGVKWEEVANLMREMKDRGERFTTQSGTAEQLGCSPSTVNRAIQGTPDLKEWSTRPVSSATGMQSLDGLVADNIPQQSEPAPADVLEPEDIDVAMRYLMEQANPEERAQINAMKPADRRVLAETVYHDPDRAEPLMRWREEHKSRDG